MRRSLVLALLLGLSPSSGTALEHGQSVPFRSQDSDVVVPVHVGGRGPYQFLLDTGSSRSAIAARLANDLRLESAGTTAVLTPTRRITRATVRAAIALGGTRMNVEAMVLPPSDLGHGIDGIVAIDFLAALRFTIDYAARRVVFNAPRAAKGGTSVSLTHDSAGFFVNIPLRDGGGPLRLIPDSGTARFVLFAREGRQLRGVRPYGFVPLETVGGLAVERAVLLERMRIGGIEVADQLAVVVDRPHIDARLGDGLLPLHLFAQVAFDVPAGWLTIFPYR